MGTRACIRVHSGCQTHRSKSHPSRVIIPLDISGQYSNRAAFQRALLEGPATQLACEADLSQTFPSRHQRPHEQRA